MNAAEHYSYGVRWSADDAAYVGTVAELPSLSWVAEERLAAFEGIQRVALDVVDEMIASGEVPPTALGDRSYSGRFVVRIPSEVHRRLALRAAEQNISLNRLVSARLAG